MNRVFIVLLLLFPLTGYCQNFIGKTRTRVIKELQHQVAKNDSLTITLTENDSVVIYSIKGPAVLPADFIYGFDKSGKCRSEKVVAGCEACFNKYLQNALDNKRYKWKKINENQYISTYAARMMIELPPENKDFSYTVLSTEWTKELYTMLKGN
ncbi:MAG: hypothetical protein H7Y01_15680 [Ferruginibacter sp.]|nr:hypothetical protein [Chitinophagaceae bacterium]